MNCGLFLVCSAPKWPKTKQKNGEKEWKKKSREQLTPQITLNIVKLLSGRWTHTQLFFSNYWVNPLGQWWGYTPYNLCICAMTPLAVPFSFHHRMDCFPSQLWTGQQKHWPSLCSTCRRNSLSWLRQGKSNWCLHAAHFSRPTNCWKFKPSLGEGDLFGGSCLQAQIFTDWGLRGRMWVFFLTLSQCVWLPHSLAWHVCRLFYKAKIQQRRWIKKRGGYDFCWSLWGKQLLIQVKVWCYSGKSLN